MTDMLYLLLKGMQTELDSIYFEGSALRHLQKPKLKSLAIYIPTDEELKTFNSIVASLFNKIAANVSENKILEHTRDALLPKLMSGEIDVSKVDISDPSCLDKSLFILFSDACAGRFFDLLPFAQIYVGCGGVTTSDDRLNCHHLSCGLLPLIHVLSDRRQNTA